MVFNRLKMCGVDTCSGTARVVRLRLDAHCVFAVHTRPASGFVLAKYAINVIIHCVHTYTTSTNPPAVSCSIRDSRKPVASAQVEHTYAEITDTHLLSGYRAVHCRKHWPIQTHGRLFWVSLCVALRSYSRCLVASRTTYRSLRPPPKRITRDLSTRSRTFRLSARLFA